MPKFKHAPMAGRWERFYAKVAEQGGLIVVWQAEEIGISRSLLISWLNERRWRRVLRGVYLAPGVELTPDIRLRAAVLVVQGCDDRHVALSHTSAAFVWDLVRDLSMPIHMTVGPDRQPMRPEITVHRSTLVDFDRDVVIRRSVPVLAIERTLFSLARALTPGTMSSYMATVQRKRYTTLSKIESDARSLGRFPGKRTVLLALEQMQRKGYTHSQLETIARRILGDRGLKPFPMPYTVLDEKGRFVAEVDIAFIAEKVAVAIDGPHHDDPTQRRFDEDQRQALEALGWIVIRADEIRLTKQPQLFGTQVERALARRRVA